MKNLPRILFVTALILAVPLVMTQISDEWDWTLSDFIIIGTLLIGFGLLIDVVVRKITKPVHRALVVVGLVAALLLIWAELAVGIFGTPFAGS